MGKLSKPYWLFVGNFYYPSGGMKDFKESYNTYEEATKEGQRFIEKEPLTWFHVLDLAKGQAIGDDGDTAKVCESCGKFQVCVDSACYDCYYKQQ